MYSVFRYTDDATSSFKDRFKARNPQEERDRRQNATELVEQKRNEVMGEYPPIYASEIMSLLFRQRGVPCLDKFTYEIIGRFRKGFGFDENVTDTVRKFMPLSMWYTNTMKATMWTIEPVLSSLVMKGNSTSCEVAKQAYLSDLVIDEPMSLRTDRVAVMDDNEMKGRWAGWLLWRASEINDWHTDSVCTNCNLSSSMIGFTIQIKGMNMLHLATTPGTIDVISPHAKRMARSLRVTVTTKENESTKLVIQPSVSTSRSSSLRVFGNGSMQFCGSPLDIETVVSALFVILKEVMRVDAHSFLASMREMKRYGS